MKRFKALDNVQKGILFLLAAMILIFSAVYPYVISRKGFLYQDAILVPSQENGETIYSGKINGETAIFTVSADRTIRFTHGTTDYGSYLVREDPGAVPKDEELADRMTGLEILREDELLFRGGMIQMDDGSYWLFDEEGYLKSHEVNVAISVGTTMYDENGNEIDPMAPSLTTIVTLYYGPELTHKGVGLAWFGGVFLCVLTAMTILYADELFRWHLSFRIRDVDRAEPTEWELGTRYMEWILLPILALATFIMGLT